MKQEIYNENSYGIIPLIYEDKSWHVLMVQQKEGHWSFPKGHPNPYESPMITAEREFYEETGLSLLKWLPLEPIREEYSFTRNNKAVAKQVIYYFATVASSKDTIYSQMKLQREEIQQATIIEISKAGTLASFPEMKDMCNKLLMILDGFIS